MNKDQLAVERACSILAKKCCNLQRGCECKNSDCVSCWRDFLYSDRQVEATINDNYIFERTENGDGSVTEAYYPKGEPFVIEAEPVDLGTVFIGGVENATKI